MVEASDLPEETSVSVLTLTDLEPASIKTSSDLHHFLFNRAYPLLRNGSHHAIVVPRGPIDRSQFEIHQYRQPGSVVLNAFPHQHHAVCLAPLGDDATPTLLVPRDGVAKALWQVMKEQRWRMILDTAFSPDLVQPIVNTLETTYGKYAPDDPDEPRFAPRRSAQEALRRMHNLIRIGYPDESMDDLYSFIAEVQRHTAGSRTIEWKNNDMGIIWEMKHHCRLVTETTRRRVGETLHLIQEGSTPYE